MPVERIVFLCFFYQLSRLVVRRRIASRTHRILEMPYKMTRSICRETFYIRRFIFFSRFYLSIVGLFLVKVSRQLLINAVHLLT